LLHPIEIAAVNPEASTPLVQTCSRCGASLDVSGNVPGVWLACSGCGQPMQVRPRAVARPKPPPLPEPENVVWAEDPRVVAVAEDRLERTAIAPKSGCLPIALLCGFSGVATVMFVGTYLAPQGATELGTCFVFGVTLALFNSAMTRSILGRNLERIG
jgi:hypothetical protein